jgi:hypothetical protein
VVGAVESEQDGTIRHAGSVVRTNRARIRQWTVRLGSHHARRLARAPTRPAATTGHGRMRTCPAGLTLSA